MTEYTLSTTAMRAYWMGRYLERSGSIARLILVNANLLIDLPARLPLGWFPLVDILALDGQYLELYPKSKRAPSQETQEKQVVKFLLTDTRNPGSLLNTLSYAKENARTLRGVLPRATYQYINDANLYAKEALSEPLSRTRRNNALQHLVERVQQIDGFLSTTMLKDASWDFLHLGSQIERADMTTRVIDLRTNDLLVDQVTDLTPFQDIQWRSVLTSLNAMHSYALATQKPIDQADVLEFLLKNPDLPRSLNRCLKMIHNCVRELPKNSALLKRVDQTRKALARRKVGKLDGADLHRFIDKQQQHLYTLHENITKNYFP